MVRLTAFHALSLFYFWSFFLHFFFIPSLPKPFLFPSPLLSLLSSYPPSSSPPPSNLHAHALQSSMSRSLPPLSLLLLLLFGSRPHLLSKHSAERASLSVSFPLRSRHRFNVLFSLRISSRLVSFPRYVQLSSMDLALPKSPERLELLLTVMFIPFCLSKTKLATG